MCQNEKATLYRTEAISDEMAHWYKCECENEYNLSFWFPKIKDCGIKVPATDVYQVPADVFEAFFLEHKGDRELIRDFISETIIPKMSQPQYFVKNGCFSSKFDFRVCLTNKYKVVEDIIAINYQALCVESGGCTEIIFREPIPFNLMETPCIYHGMPLQTEIRTFYDFDKHELLYSSNYWDFDTVRPHLRDMTDIIVFEAMKDKILAGYDEWQPKVEALVAEHMAKVELAGKWSIDFLVDFKGQIWLIDMAKANRSTYWNGGLLSD